MRYMYIIKNIKILQNWVWPCLPNYIWPQKNKNVLRLTEKWIMIITILQNMWFLKIMSEPKCHHGVSRLGASVRWQSRKMMVEPYYACFRPMIPLLRHTNCHFVFRWMIFCINHTKNLFYLNPEKIFKNLFAFINYINYYYDSEKPLYNGWESSHSTLTS